MIALSKLIWAEKLSAKASEIFKSEQVVGIKSVAWRVRYRTDIDNLDRIFYDNEHFNVIGITEEGNKDSLIIVTEAVLGR
jgi:head-tail adaptor